MAKAVQGTAMEPKHDKRFGDDESVRASTIELVFMDAADLYPELAAVALPGLAAAMTINDEDGAEGLRALAGVMSTMARELCNGRLRHLLPRILARTTLVVPGPDGQPMQAKCGTEEGLNRAFMGPRKKLARPIVQWVVGINFADFFDVGDLLKYLPTKKAVAASSEDSSPSTSTDGEDTSSG